MSADSWQDMVPKGKRILHQTLAQIWKHRQDMTPILNILVNYKWTGLISALTASCIWILKCSLLDNIYWDGCVVQVWKQLCTLVQDHLKHNGNSLASFLKVQGKSFERWMFNPSHNLYINSQMGGANSTPAYHCHSCSFLMTSKPTQETKLISKPEQNK